MIRTILTPSNTDLHLAIPKDYVGKQIEILLYTLDEIKEEKTNSLSVSPLRGKLQLSEEQYSDFQQYVKDSRKKWNRDI